MTLGHDPSPSASSRFRFQIVGKNFDSLNLSIQSVPIAGVQMNDLDFYVGGRNTQVPDNNLSYEPIVVNFILSEDLNEWLRIYQWMVDSSNYNETYDYLLECVLTVLDSQNQPIVRFTYHACMPSDLGGIQLSYIDDTHCLSSSVTLLTSTCTVTNLSDGTTIEDL